MDKDSLIQELEENIANPNNPVDKSAIAQLKTLLDVNFRLATPLRNGLFPESGCQPINAQTGLDALKLVYQFVYGHQLLISKPHCRFITDIVNVPKVIDGNVVAANLNNRSVCANCYHYWGDKVIGVSVVDINGVEQTIPATILRLDRPKQAAELRQTFERHFLDKADIFHAMNAINSVADERLTVIQTIQDQVNQLAENRELSDDCLNDLSDLQPLMIAIARIYYRNARALPCTANLSGCCLNLRHYSSG